MCNPVFAAVGAAVISGASVVGQIQQAKAAAKAINAQSAQQQEENRARAAGEMFDRSVETFERIGMQRVAGAQRGLNDASRTLELAHKALLFDDAFDDSRTMLNYENAEKARIARTKSALAQASRPTLLGAGLQIAGSALQTYTAAGGFN